jgi:hypothetical protein
MGDYVTRDQVRRHLGYRPEFVEDDEQIEAAIAAAEALIVDYCGRPFTVDASATERVYEASGFSTLTVVDVSDTATAVVETSSDRLTWTVEDSDGYYFDGATGWPATKLCRLADVWSGWVKVTAEHGWLAPPEAVVAATKLVVSQLLSRRHSPNGIEAMADFGAVRASRYIDGHAELLLRPYRLTSAFLGVA